MSNNKGNNNIPSSLKDDTLLTEVTEKVCSSIRDRHLPNLPDNWDIECTTKRISYDEIRQKVLENGLSVETADKYYGSKSSIITDAYIINIVVVEGEKRKYLPIFMGEMKKQGTNCDRMKEGKNKQAIGNAAGDRTAKNFEIAADYCYLTDKTLFPYNAFFHGCDFADEEISETTKGKLKPFFGELNVLNPYFDKDVWWTRKGGSCFYQSEDYTFEQLYDICHACCEIGVDYYKSKHGLK